MDPTKLYTEGIKLQSKFIACIVMQIYQSKSKTSILYTHNLSAIQIK